jgi:hypothetical protein
MGPVEMCEIFVIEELWLDSMENLLMYARGYKPIGYVETQAEAEKLIIEAGVEIGDGWPVMKGEQLPRKRVRPLQKLTPNAPHERAAEGGPLDAVVVRQK